VPFSTLHCDVIWTVINDHRHVSRQRFSSDTCASGQLPNQPLSIVAERGMHGDRFPAFCPKQERQAAICNMQVKAALGIDTESPADSLH
jgi:hypothetical protein